MKRLVLSLTLAVLAFSATVQAQSYTTSVGLRLGNGSPSRTAGLTIQQRLAKKVTVEGIFQTDFRHNSTFHFLGQKHIPILTRRLNFYMGGGLSFGSEQSEVVVGNQVETTTGNATVGVDMVAGVELTLSGLNVSLDYKPNFNVAGRDPWMNSQVGFSVRTVVLKSNFFKKMKRKRQKRKKQKAKAKEKANQPEKGGMPSWWPFGRKGN